MKQPTCLHPVPVSLWAVPVRLEGLVAEEVVTLQAATQLLQEAQHIANAVHHQQALEVLLPLERSCNWKAKQEQLNTCGCMAEGRMRAGEIILLKYLHVLKYFAKLPYLRH